MIHPISIEKATLYEKYRLPYAPQAVEELFGYTGEVKVVADIGAGTGQLARLFAGRCKKVYAIEPDSAMCQVGATALQDFAASEIIPGYAEETTLTDNCIDLIVIGNAFHRFEPRACEEFRRILKPQGWIALFSYKFSNNAFTDMLLLKLNEMKGLASKVEKTWYRTPIQALFGDAQIQEISFRQSQREDWTAFFGAACAGIEAPEPGDPEFGQFEGLNREVFDRFAVNGEIQIDYETQVTFGQPVFQAQGKKLLTQFGEDTAPCLSGV